MKLNSVVVHFVQCFNCCQDDSRNRCSRLLNDILLNGCEDDESKSLSYLWFFNELSKSDNNHGDKNQKENEGLLHLRGLLRDVMKLRKLMRCLLEEGQRKSSFDVFILIIIKWTDL